MTLHLLKRPTVYRFACLTPEQRGELRIVETVGR